MQTRTFPTIRAIDKASEQAWTIANFVMLSLVAMTVIFMSGR
ncbi:hypothetical protein [Singulisphaera sp. PoT]